MIVNKEVAKLRTEMSRKILRRYMIDVTQQTSVPGKQKGGSYALLLEGTGEVWLAETKSFSTLLKQWRTGRNGPDCYKQAVANGDTVRLYILTRPDDFDVKALEEELATADLLAARKTRDLTRPGSLFTIRHDVTHDYFVIECRNQTPLSTLLSMFLDRLSRLAGGSYNKRLNQFVTDQADDILKNKHFTISEVATFTDAEDAWLKRQVYIDECKYGNNLNWRDVA